MKAIPEIQHPERFDLSDFIDSRFVEVISNEYIDVEMQYPLLNMKNAEMRCYVREEVYCLLINAAKKLPQGYKFMILDAWRPFALQKELYNVYSSNIIKDFGLGKCGEECKKSVIKKYVSEPLEDVKVPPVHTTGGAIDLTIIDKNGLELDMGTRFDAFSDRAATCYYESGSNDRIRDNRRMLYNIMTSEGFTNLPSEWWHFDYGDSFWAYYNNRPAIYNGVFTKESMNG